MKIRTCHVSNSSASSFCIYGFIKKFQGYDDYENYFNTSDNEYAKLEKELTKVGLRLITRSIPDGGNSWETITGIGKAGCEIDHYLPDGEDWRDFSFPAPLESEKIALQNIMKKLGIEEPLVLMEKTWWD